MGIDLRIPEWTDNDTATHESTTWEIHSNSSYTDLLDSSVEDTEHKIRWISALQLPEDTTWYARCKRHFSDGTDSGWINTTVIDYNRVIDYNARDKDYIVDTPFVIVDRVTAMDTNHSTLDIACSDFKCIDSDNRGMLRVETHESTCWLVYGDNNAILYSRLYDKDNKTELEINKTDIPNYETQESLIVKVIHVDSSGKESGVGQCNVKGSENCATGLKLYNY